MFGQDDLKIQIQEFGPTENIESYRGSKRE